MYCDLTRPLGIGMLSFAALAISLPVGALAADPKLFARGPGGVGGVQPPAEPSMEVVMDEPTRKATAKALEWLASKQNSDGSWSASEGGRYPHNTAITSFALLAFMSQGHLPNQGQYAPEVARGARFLMASQREDGYLIGRAGEGRASGNMYCHGMATLTLAELYGMTGDDQIKPILKKAVNLIIGSQCREGMGPAEGGWRYEPRPTGADISVTIMQVMALRAAKNSGIHVPDETLDRAIAYVMRCYNPQKGAFSYQPGTAPGYARTAAGTCVLQLTMKYDTRQLTPEQLKEKEAKDRAIANGIRYLHSMSGRGGHYWYGNYYACHALHQAGGKEWKQYYENMRSTLLPRQSTDGSWSTFHPQVGPVFNTSIAVIILSVPQNYLPIFQR